MKQSKSKTKRKAVKPKGDEGALIPAVLAIVKRNNVIKGRMIAENDVHPLTVERWIKNNSDKLALPKNTQIICEELSVGATIKMKPENILN